MNEKQPEKPVESLLGASIGPRTRRAVKFSLRVTSIAVVVVLLVALGLASWLVGSAGLRAVGLCAVAGAAILAVTFGSHLFTMKNPSLMMAGMGADFVLKIVVILVSLLVARRMPDLDARTIFFTMLAIILVQAVTFPIAISQARVPLLDPEPRPVKTPEPEVNPGDPG